MNQHREEPRARRRDVMGLLAASRPASLQPPSMRSAGTVAAAHAAASRPSEDCRADRIPRARHARKWTIVTACVVFTAVGATVAVLMSPVRGGTPHVAPDAAPVRGAHARPAQPATAREILLTAAAHVASAPVTARYWRVREIGGITFPGGTKADPYDISLATSLDQWNPSSAGRKEWVISRRLGARPATPADAAAWRVAGSPATWRSGQPAYRSDASLAGYPLDWYGRLAATAAASPRSATWQVSDGTVGYVEGDEPGLTAAQFRRMPGRPAPVRAMLRHYARLTWCVKHAAAGCSTVDQIVWAEAVSLLQDPVSAQIRSAAFKVMATLPGVRSLGEMTDPLGRRGYGLAAGSEEPRYGEYNPTRAIVIDPRTGSLLATEDIGPMPRTLACLSFDEANLNPKSRALAGKPVRPGERLPRPKDVITKCTASSYDGRSYSGQVDTYVALVSEGWTNASPVLPRRSRRSGPTGSPGLPPAS